MPAHVRIRGRQSDRVAAFASLWRLSRSRPLGVRRPLLDRAPYPSPHPALRPAAGGGQAPSSPAPGQLKLLSKRALRGSRTRSGGAPRDSQGICLGAVAGPRAEVLRCDL